MVLITPEKGKGGERNKSDVPAWLQWTLLPSYDFAAHGSGAAAPVLFNVPEDNALPTTKSEIIALQQKLSDAGLYVAPGHNYHNDGVIGEITQHGLKLARNPQYAEEYLQRVLLQSEFDAQDMLKIQAALNRAGYPIGPVDGKMTEQTRTAILKYVEDRPELKMDIETAPRQRARGDVEISHTSSFTGNTEGIVLQRPVDESIPESSPFGMRDHPVRGGRQHHDGIDYAAANNTPIYAPADGQVTYVGASTGYGNIVVLDHGHGVYTLYAHLDQADIRGLKKGELVKSGEEFAKTGNSGVGTGAHLHYEVLIAQKDGPPVNVDPKKTIGLNLTDASVQKNLTTDAIAEASRQDVTTKVAALQNVTPPGLT